MGDFLGRQLSGVDAYGVDVPMKRICPGSPVSNSRHRLAAANRILAKVRLGNSIQIIILDGASIENRHGDKIIYVGSPGI